MMMMMMYNGGGGGGDKGLLFGEFEKKDEGGEDD
jgi:hypothetical protein